MLSFEKQVTNNPFQELQSILENGTIKLRMILFRHGPKKEASGEKDVLADYFVNDVENGVESLALGSADYVHLLSSPAERAINTRDVAENMLGDKGKTKPLNNRLGTFENLSQELKQQLEILVKYQHKLEEKIKNEGEEVDDTKESLADMKNKIDSVILANMFDETLGELGRNLGVDESLEIKTDDFAHNLEEHTKAYLKHLSLLKDVHKKPASLNITHSYPIMSFLRNNIKFIEGGEILSAKDMRGEDFLKKVGGCVKEAQGINFDYIQKGDKKIIKVSGPSFTGYIDYD